MADIIDSYAFSRRLWDRVADVTEAQIAALPGGDPVNPTCEVFYVGPMPDHLKALRVVVDEFEGEHVAADKALNAAPEDDCTQELTNAIRARDIANLVWATFYAELFAHYPTEVTSKYQRANYDKKLEVYLYNDE